MDAAYRAEIGRFDPESKSYFRYHRRRYERLGDLVARFVPTAARPNSSPRLLDIGPSFETLVLASRFPKMIIDTAGFEDHRFPRRTGERHHHADLNATHEAENPSPLYDAVVAAEVLEHLHVAAPGPLSWFSEWLRPEGVLLIQTPNAVSWNRRLKMLAGRNPLEPIRADSRNPGHFHEFTRAELVGALADAGLETVAMLSENYFGSDSRVKRLASRAAAVLPGNLLEGFSAVARKR
jgi:trans-aconitate methyltransferase